MPNTLKQDVATTPVVKLEVPVVAEGATTDVHQHKNAEGTEVIAKGKQQDCSQCNPKDAYGRDAAERTIELSPEDAELINQEVELGKWDSFDDAHHDLLKHGIAERKRVRDAAQKTIAVKVLALKTAEWTKIMQADPALVTNPTLVGKMMAELGALSAKASKK